MQSEYILNDVGKQLAKLEFELFQVLLQLQFHHANDDVVVLLVIGLLGHVQQDFFLGWYQLLRLDDVALSGL